ncbi:uncharacterized protein LOC124532428 [Vanessa cardui]|uniref:uncharacterized protein LOC124532428 n=1 Tax=Vanessa cardui TaxID=171605 RepID=UPI001F1381BF|nr:uncharacterized protein LOC124532428 [Vanessa cardui]
MQIFLILMFLDILVADGPINYCGAKMCGHTDSHTFCRYPPGPSPSCMGYIESELSPNEKARVLARLNRRRSDTARGIRGLPTAGDMLKLRWVEELAREAQRWADQCQPPDTPELYDACRDLYSISVGQCIASVVGEAPGLRPETMVDLWYTQSMSYKGNATSYIPSHRSHYDDFAQMVWSRTYMVGCGRSKFMIPWRGRQRTVERLVCNFAPRGPAAGRALWSPAAPASACPPRSRPDIDLPGLCTFQYDLDETYDEDNIMTVEEHLLLNTVMLIEKNLELDNIGTLDEIYLTKLAVATIEDSALTQTPYNTIQKRDIVDTEEIISSNAESNIKIDTKPIGESNENNKSTHSMNKKVLKQKGNFVGRPKAYNMDDLNDQHKNEANNDKETTIDAKYVDDDYELTFIQEDTTRLTHSITTEVSAVPINYTYSKAMEIDKANTTIINIETSTIMTTKMLDIYIDDIIANLNISSFINETAIDENILEDYLSDPETVRQIQASLNRMEQKLAVPVTASGKARRELRNLEQDKQNLKRNQEILSAEAERNKSLERGPMLNMVLKYMPYLKHYEKNILGDSSSSGRESSQFLALSSILIGSLISY